MRADFNNDPFFHFLSSHKREVEKIFEKSVPRYATLAASGLVTGGIALGDFFGPNKKVVIKAKYRSLLSKQISAVLTKQGIHHGDHYVEIFKKKFFFVNIDAGANIGIFSVLAAHLCPKGKIYSFEPASTTFDALNKNAGQYENMSAYHNGVGDQRSTKKLWLKPSALGANYIEDTIMVHHPTEYVGSEEVVMVTVDDFVNSKGLPWVDFIKIDTEGYELNILKGAKETIRRFSPVIAMSAYHHPSHKIDLPEYILSINPAYHYELHTEGEEDFFFWV